MRWVFSCWRLDVELRAKDAVPKQLVVLAGKPLIIHGLEIFERLDYIGTKYIVCSPDQKDRMDDVLREHRISNYVLVEGGESRAASVRNGLRHVQRARMITHNAAMPFVTESLIGRVAAEDYDCVTTVTPLEYNLCEGDDFAERVVPRERLKLINTPPRAFARRCSGTATSVPGVTGMCPPPTAS